MILLDPLARPVIGHRGNRAHAPEETLPSLLEAVGLGVDALEFDVHVSRDGQLVLLHDPTLDRTTNERGPVASRTLGELQRIDAGYRFTTDGGRTFPWRGRGATIASFDDVVEALPRTLPLIIELKTPTATEPVRRAIARHNLASRVIVAGFDDASVAPLRGHGIALGASTKELTRCLAPSLLGMSISPAFQSACIPPTHNFLPLPIRAFVRAFRSSGVTTHVWTINDPAHAERLWRAGVNGIISDNPRAILSARDRDIAR